ncbi:elongation factor G-like protein EF-G2 [Actinorugispora endophytica]|uniref:Elongation factor G-like protein n=1 Tax=Actinorugispora endophytica TaxID=1605990 RepID=A0A4R6UR02_9ACTN|nr:elongation factor G-like protein EF-G2 [Actinorugispora endophytica]TDQ47993.1 translation elongation factor 2 (EF-2/EF-G) [Actinorugispora endophytica]
MADKSGSATVGRAPRADQPQRIRNVVLIGRSGSGKTTLVESLLLASGTVNRAGRVEEGTTVSDHDDVEARQQRSVNLAVAPLWVGDVKVNLLDTPGYADFVGDLRAGLRAADAALFVVSGVDGVDGRTRLLWEECAALDMPRAVAVTKIDHHRADFSEVVAQCRAAFGDGVMPAYVPVVEGEGDSRAVRGLLGLLSRRYYDYSGGERVETDPSPDLAAETEQLRTALIEGVIQESEDETLMDRYMAGEELDRAMLVTDLEAAVARGGFHPVLAMSALSGVGVPELLAELPLACPSPAERPLPPVTTVSGRPVPDLACDPEGPLLAEVVKTVSDPYVGRVSLVRVFSGTLRADEVVHVCGHGLADRGHEDHDADERIGPLSVPLGKQNRPTGAVVAGDICAVAKLTRAETGDTLSDKDRPLRMPPWSFPDPLLPTALRAAHKADEDRLAQAIARLTSEDVTLRVEVNPETHQMVLWCMGEAHLDLALDRLANRYGVPIETEEVIVPLRETFAVPAQGLGRNVKQSGGHGEYGVCRIRVEPLPSGAGLEFVDEIVGGVVPRQYIPSVEKGVRAQMEQGVLAGYPMVDIRVTLYDGKAHSVDSSDMAFQKAGRLALKDAAERTRVAMLEPVDLVSVLVPDEYMGAVMSDLSARRGRVVGSDPVAGGRILVKAEVPQLEISRYAIDLRSLSHGTGTFNREYLRHEPLPPQLAKEYAEGGS